MDALSYTQLGESNISSKLPEIAMRQYKIAEANREKTEKQHTDLIGLFKYKVEGFNPDITGLTKGYEAIVQKGSEIALKQGYAAAQQYVQTQKDLLDGIGKMSSAQKQKSDLLFKDLSDKKKWNEDPEGYMQSMENYRKYVMSDEPTKQDYANIRKKYGYSDAIPDEALRAVVRQNTFGEGENILKYEPIGDYRKEAKEWALNPTTKETSLGEYTMGKDGNIYHGTKTEVKYDKSLLEKQMSDFFALAKTNTGVNVYKAAERELKKAGAIPQDVDVNTPEGYKQVFDAWKTRPSTMELFKKEGEKTTLNESKVGDGKGGFNFNFGTGYGENDKYSFSSTVTKTPDMSGNKERKVGVLNITKKNANDPDIKIQAPRNTLVYDEAKKQWIRHQGSGSFVISEPHLEVSEGGVSGKFLNGVPTEDVTRFGKGVYLKATTLIAEPEYIDPTATDKNKLSNIKKYNNVLKEIMIPIDGNMNAIATEFGIPENEFKKMLNTTIDKHNNESGSGFTIQRYNIGGGSQSVPTKQKINNQKTTVSGGSIR